MIINNQLSFAYAGFGSSSFAGPNGVSTNQSFMGAMASINNIIMAPLQNKTGCWAWREEAEIIHIGWWRNRNKTFNLRTAHQKLHPDPCTERKSTNPHVWCVWVNLLHPIKRRRSI